MAGLWSPIGRYQELVGSVNVFWFVEFWGLQPIIPLLQYVNRLGFEICSDKQNKETWLR